MLDFITMVDGYKVDHRRQYPAGTQFVYSNFTPRGSRVPGQTEVVFFGLQYFLSEYLGCIARDTFFNRRERDVTASYQRMLDAYLGPNDIGVKHIADLHKLGYLPLQFKALPEGTPVPLRVPMFTLENTHADFFWVTNYIETLLSSVLWHACTSATTAYRFRRLLNHWAIVTGGDPAFVPWQGHDFSFRGLSGPEAAALSGAAHLLSFTGTDCIPAIQLLEDHYSSTGLVGGSVPATEHSVMCAGGEHDELATFDRLLDIYPTGIVSIVSDTWDLWHVVDSILPKLKDKIMARNGKCVIRPDSGDPADILCGDPDAKDPIARKGLVQALWDLFGGTTNDSGHRILDSHIGAIYGDSINEARARDICSRLAANDFASTNVVFGIGSYAYQYVTRDTYGFAVKATWAQVNGQEFALFKDPKTDSGEKRSARGRVVVTRSGLDGGLIMVDGHMKDSEALATENLLKPVWRNGFFQRQQTLHEIRDTLQQSAKQ